jgi:hypothetical protein
MTDEDRTAEKLRGYNVVIKFKDGEEIFVDVPDVDNNDINWFEEVDNFMHDKDSKYFPAVDISIAKDTIKYIRKI